MSNTERVIRSLRRDRPMTSVTLRMPLDVLEDLKRVAPALDFTGSERPDKESIAKAHGTRRWSAVDGAAGTARG